MWDRIRRWLMGDPSVQRVVIVESNVMGRAAVLTQASFVGIVPFLQLGNDGGSRLVSAYGGMPLSLAWSVDLFLATFLVWMSFLIRYLPAKYLGRGPFLSSLLERAGLALLIVAYAAYLAALLSESEINEAGFVIALTIGPALNFTGRFFFLWRQSRVAEQAGAFVKGGEQ